MCVSGLYLILSFRHSRYFHVQCPPCVCSKYTCASVRPYALLAIAMLTQEKLIAALTDKKLGQKSMA